MIHTNIIIVGIHSQECGIGEKWYTFRIIVTHRNCKWILQKFRTYIHICIYLYRSAKSYSFIHFTEINPIPHCVCEIKRIFFVQVCVTNTVLQKKIQLQLQRLHIG